MRKTETISLKIRNDTMMSTLSTLIQHSTEFPARAIKQEEEIKEIQQTVKVFLIADTMILYLKDPNNSTPKLIETINSFNNVVGYKINL
jgi:hypothetical protein